MAGNFIDITFNLDNFKSSMENIKKLELAIENGVHKGINEIANRAEDKMRERLSYYGLSNSSLYNSISTEITSDGIYISVNKEHAIYVEYGTGIVGLQNPHPSLSGWKYDINEHGEKGWYYPKDDGTFGWTKGMPSRPFIYETWLWTRRSSHQIIMKNIRKEKERLGVK